MTFPTGSNYTCLKTGARIIVAGSLCYGDMFTIGGWVLFRCVDHHPIQDAEKDTLINASFNTWYDWFDKEHTCGETPSTIILKAPHDFDYEGRPWKG